MFAYPDAARYRLGPNYQQLPPNAAKCPVYSPYQRDGFPSIKGNYGGDPNYVGSGVLPVSTRDIPENHHDHWVGQVTAFSSEVTDEDFVQPRDLWQRVLAKQPGQQENLIDNVASFVAGAQPDIRKKTYGSPPSSFRRLLCCVFLMARLTFCRNVLPR